MLSSEVIRKKTFLPKTLFWLFLPLEAKPSMLAEIGLHASERTAQELSNALFPGLLLKIVSEMISHFRRNPDFSLNLTFGDLNIDLSEKLT